MENIEIKTENTPESTLHEIGLAQLEEMLRNNIKPPGIMEYDDMPPEQPLVPTKSIKSKIKKPWETDDNVILKSNAEETFGDFETKNN